MKNGVPFDVAFALDPVTVQGWSIIFGELDGGKWSWNTLGWEGAE